MGGKEVEGGMNPVSSATSYEEVGLTADTQGGPRAKIYPLVEFWLATLPDVPKVLFEAPKRVLHDQFPVALNTGTPFACFSGAGHTTTW
jgi:hypothetical protein